MVSTWNGAGHSRIAHVCVSPKLSGKCCWAVFLSDVKRKLFRLCRNYLCLDFPGDGGWFRLVLLPEAGGRRHDGESCTSGPNRDVTSARHVIV